MIDYSKWSILPQQFVWKKDNLFRYHAHHIVHLDDHRIFRKGVKQACIDNFFPNAKLIEFAEGYEAFIYVANHLSDPDPIDLIITDINHPGFDGLTFVPLVRYLEKLYRKEKPIPIIVITMYEAEVFKNRLPSPENPLVNNYLQKCTSPAEIIYWFEKVLL